MSLPGRFSELNTAAWCRPVFWCPTATLQAEAPGRRFSAWQSPPQRHFTSACRTEGLSSKIITALYSGPVYNTALHRLFKKRYFSQFEEIGWLQRCVNCDSAKLGPPALRSCPPSAPPASGPSFAGGGRAKTRLRRRCNVCPRHSRHVVPLCLGGQVRAAPRRAGGA